MSSLDNIMKYLGAVLHASGSAEQNDSSKRKKPEVKLAGIGPVTTSQKPQVQLAGIGPVTTEQAPQVRLAGIGPVSTPQQYNVIPETPTIQQGPKTIPFAEFYALVGGDKTKAEALVPGITGPNGAKLLRPGPDGRPYITISGDE